MLIKISTKTYIYNNKNLFKKIKTKVTKTKIFIYTQKQMSNALWMTF